MGGAVPTPQSLVRRISNAVVCALAVMSSADTSLRETWRIQPGQGPHERATNLGC